ncbi:hypothetical protein FNV43_RR13988 [Rhamnella rubrinervis]|uniref:Bifunctional inhibitor/plant lipid transfer protein/seed storage helical domain-containing protein n=1 Tax=Rhamnella rubrinervis TaxID=2594499 RepID=A0A8K0H2F6_9ROSA|nr:hypothetical protein FNV43_RR13988 [Rhamnella rubrinervis]
MKSLSFLALCAVVTAAVVLFGNVRTAHAVTCTITELSPCQAFITWPVPQLVFMLITVLSGKLDHMAVAAQLCSPLEMEPCKPAIATVTPPSSICCRNVREQRPCYCEYLKDPNLDVNTPRARRVAATCGVRLPDCYLL